MDAETRHPTIKHMKKAPWQLHVIQARFQLAQKPLAVSLWLTLQALVLQHSPKHFQTPADSGQVCRKEKCFLFRHILLGFTLSQGKKVFTV